MVLLPETNLAGALSVAENVRLSIASALIDHAGSSLGILTISSGVVAINSPIKDSYTAALAEADRLLYLAKSKGRNAVEGQSMPDTYRLHQTNVIDLSR